MTNLPETGKSPLYAKVLLDHNRNPRNFRSMKNATHILEGYNPLCGDRFTVFLRLEEGRIADVSFEGNGCAISKSSASLMTNAVKNRTPAEAEALFTQLHRVLSSSPETPFDDADLGELEALVSIREYPVRIKCAVLPWHAMLSALRDDASPASTE